MAYPCTPCPRHRGWWDEPPLEAARREIREELALAVGIREADLLAVEWIQARQPREAPARLAFLFAGPVLTADDSAQIALQHAELSAWRWTRREEAAALLRPAVARRIVNPLQLPGGATYQNDELKGRPYEQLSRARDAHRHP
ncbi:NUDIX domain-containing protein [Streptomyces sp. DT24]|uniref:NUDIX domain-containing protein n=1 Tax=unclassified Streptomyces TaxID=2593676 RepID=UPI003CEAEC39